jgi:hypothetical protein
VADPTRRAALRRFLGAFAWDPSPVPPDALELGLDVRAVTDEGPPATPGRLFGSFRCKVVAVYKGRAAVVPLQEPGRWVVPFPVVVRLDRLFFDTDDGRAAADAVALKLNSDIQTPDRR